MTGRDVYLTETSCLRTPWYRLLLTNAESSQVVIRLKLDNTGGRRTEVEYPLTVKRDEFYSTTSYSELARVSPKSPIVLL